MAANPRQLYEGYSEALEIYNELKELLDSNKLAQGQVYSYPTTHSYAIFATNIEGIINSLLATKSLSIVQQSEPINGAALQWVVDDNPVAAEYGSDYTNELQSYVDYINLHNELYSIFSNKIIPPKLGQKFAFQNKYKYAFDAGIDCNSVIEQISGQYLVGLICFNQGEFYQIVTN